jgi:beta-N-acetylhexosaminidase
MTRFADRVGQHFVVDFSGPEITPELERLIHDGRIGGVILFTKNIRFVPQVRTLTADLQRLAAEAGLPPLFITIDQEGGLVNRLIDGFTVFPSAMALGASSRAAEDVATAGRITALELRAVGVNTNHAPVLDVNTNPDNPVIGVRSFGDDPRQVAQLGAAYVQAAQAAGVLTTVKHFPGHGATAVDSHLDLPVVSKDVADFRREDLLPFAEAVRAGAAGLMTAHILYPALDPEHPATLSSRILTDVLRGELGFDGVTFTDSMAMTAVAARWPRGQAAVAALRAGADIVLACGQHDAQWASIEAARRAVEDGTLDASTLSAAATRIARVKAQYVTAPGSGDVGTEAHRRQAQDIADRTVTLVRNRAMHIPLPAGRTVVLHVGAPAGGDSAAGDGRADLRLRLGADLAALIPNVTVATDGREIVSRAWDSVVVVSSSQHSAQGVQTIETFRQHFGQRLVVVGAGDPYELLRFPEVDTYLAAYGPDPASMRAAARILSGTLQPAGRLSVALPGLHPRGHAA